MNTEDPQDRIDDYLLGRSADPEQFERDLAEDPQLRADMNATRQALDAITAGEDQALKARLRQLEVGLSTGKTVADPAPSTGGAKIVSLPPRKRTGWLRYVAAAAVLLLVASYFLLRPAGDAGPQLAAATFTPYANLAYPLTRSTTQADPRAAAYTAYERGDFSAAQRAFQQLGTRDPADAFYLGQSLLGQQKYSEALPIFRGLATTADFNLAPEAQYYTALALVGLDRQAEATPLLEGITADANHPLYAEATALLARL